MLYQIGARIDSRILISQLNYVIILYNNLNSSKQLDSSAMAVHVYLRVDSSEGQTGAGFPSHNTSETSLALYNTVWDAHLTAKCGQEQHNLKK